MNTEIGLTQRIDAISQQTSLQDLQCLCGDVFRDIFGITSDAMRLDDILGEALEFHRAPARFNRLEELGDLFAALLTFCVEQDVSPSAHIKRTLLKIMGKRKLYAERGNKTNTIIFGGSFDPITKGHIAAIRTPLNSNLGFHKARFMPANEYFGSKTLTPAYHRANMAKLVSGIDPRMDYFDFEIENNLFSETVNTMLRLIDSEFAQTNRFHLLISSELANNIPTWPRWEELVRLVPFVTIPRIGYQPSLRNPWFLQPPHRYIDIADAPDLIDTSSTEARRLYRARDFQAASEIVPEPIHEYILEHRLYQEAA